MATFGHILAATDFSDVSRGALELAAALAGECGAELTLLHVCEISGYAQTGPIPYDLVTPAAEEAQARLDELLLSVREVCPRAKGLVKVGVAWEQILAVAADTRADLVVMGTHGRRGISHALVGSVAERVVRLSPVAVLTVRSRHAG
jgi:nucleotide-binding universal stress UspA family protein